MNRIVGRGMLAAALAMLGCVGTPVHGQPKPDTPASGKAAAYPFKAVRIIVGNSPGGANDIIARLVGQKLSDAWGQSIIVDNRAGGSGVIAMEITARATPDGHTLLVSNSQMATNMLLGKVPFDIRKAYEPVVQLTVQGYVVAVNPSLPAGSVKELVAHAKSKPGAITFGTPGIGSPAHLGIEQFKLMTGTNMVHVPYKGNAPAMIDLMSGQIQLVFGSAPSVAPHARSGKLKALAVTTSKRAGGLPDLPTVSEAGVPGYELVNAYGFLAPAGTPPAIVAAINRTSNEIIGAREFKARLDADGVEAAQTNSPADYRAEVTREIAKLEKFFKTPGISMDAFR